MGADRAIVSPTASGRARAAAARHAGSHEWGVVDLAHRCALAGPARAIPTVPNMPSSLCGMGAHRCIGESAEVADATLTPTRQFRSVRGLHRWQLRQCKKGGAAVGKTKRGKGTKLMAVANRDGAPIAVHIESASPHEVTLVSATVDSRFTQKRPERLIGDKAYDSDKLDRQMATIGIEMIAPHRDNRTPGSQTQDGRPLRRYRRRWRVERLFAWLQNFRRLVTRYEYKAENFLGFVHLGCMIILMRTYF